MEDSRRSALFPSSKPRRVGWQSVLRGAQRRNRPRELTRAAVVELCRNVTIYGSCKFQGKGLAIVVQRLDCRLSTVVPDAG